jgi:hypothetical protein
MDEETRSPIQLPVDSSTDGAWMLLPLFESYEQGPGCHMPVLWLWRGYSWAHNFRVLTMDRASCGYPRLHWRMRPSSRRRRIPALRTPWPIKQGGGSRSARASPNQMVEGQTGLRQYGGSNSFSEGGRRVEAKRHGPRRRRPGRRAPRSGP